MAREIEAASIDRKARGERVMKEFRVVSWCVCSWKEP
jgi:hypothetical protein